jgi:ABC-type branched-subunit amino acid transport system substrate-binding protein
MNNKIVYFILSLNLFVPSMYSFTSLKDAKEYAKTIEEYPNIDNDNWLNPVFDSYQKSLNPNFFSRMLMSVGLKKTLWSPFDLKEALIQGYQRRELEGFQGRFVQILEPLEGENYMIWGDLHGAFHSLVRCLAYLESQGIISDTFKIKTNHDYFVFNGNAIDQSAYSAETLTLILNIMAVNPKKVYYLRGVHEDKQAWQDLGFGNALKTRASYVSDERIPLDTQVTKFFNTLPLALYLKGNGVPGKINFVRISPSNRQNSEIDEKKFAGYLENPSQEKNDVHLAFELKPSEKTLVMNAIIRDEDRTKKFTQTSGLVFHDPEEEAVSWSVLSAPTGTYRRMFDFFYDAFAVLTTAKNISDWTISLYNQDVREMLGFQLSKIYKLTTGIVAKEYKTAPIGTGEISKDMQTVEKKVSKLEATFEDLQKELKQIKESGVAPAKEVKPESKKETAPSVPTPDKTVAATKIPISQKMLTFGSTLDLSKEVRFKGKQLKASINALLKQMPGEGIDGIVPKVLFVDDEYTPEKARENVLRFIEQGIDKTIVSMGSPTLEKYLDLVKEKKIAVFFPTTGAPMFRKPDLTYLIHFRKSYIDEAKFALAYALDVLKIKTVAILYQNDSFGLGALEGAIQFAKERNINYQKEWTIIPYERGDLNLTNQAEKIRSVNPDAILFCALANPVKEVIRILGTTFFNQKKLIGVSDFSDRDFEDFIKGKGLQFIVMNVVPNPETSTMQIAKEFRELMKKDAIDLDAWAFEGYIAGELMLDCLKKVEKDITTESIIKQFESYKNYNFKGLELDFNPETRELSKYLWINDGESEWKQFTIEKQEKKETMAPEQKPTQIEKPATKPEVQQKTKPADVVKITEAMLTFGSSLDLSKGERFSGLKLKEGMSLYLRKMSEEGDTIQGIIPKIVFLDDEYTPEHARGNVLHFIKDGIDKTVGSPGSPTLEAYLDLVKEKKIAVFFPATGAPLFRNPELKYIVNLRNSNPQEAKAAVEYALDVDKAKKLAFFVQNDAFGKGAFEGAKLVAKSRNIDYEKQWKIVYCERTAVDLAKQVTDIKEYNPDAIIFLAIPIQGMELIRLLGSSYLVEKKMFAISDYGQSVFKEFMREKGLRVLITNVVPNPNGLTIPIVNEFRDYAKKNNIQPDTDTLEGYLSVAVLVDTIKKIKGEITVESIISQLEQIKDYNFKGLLLNFNKETRELLANIWIDTITDDWKQMTSRN